MEAIAPAETPSSAMPSWPVLNPSCSWTAGMRTAQLAVPAPVRKKIVDTAHRASRVDDAVLPASTVADDVDAYAVAIALGRNNECGRFVRSSVGPDRQPVSSHAIPLL